jgi:hypothetical protein
VITKAEALDQNGNLNIALYVRKKNGNGSSADLNDNNLAKAIIEWQTSSLKLRESLNDLIHRMEGNNEQI